ncbi:uncharacterized protein LOC133914026 [Phragmites australis]|uniref:uncharacterized protein LOC133914026 n=1 Tax=Phragmites australis TaxID=29695 RepID=UPI002D77A7ED|nr:uncharacterized protein LOC133914026 [Phragmites australis]
MEQKLSVVLALLALFLCAGPGHAMRLHDVNGGREFAFGAKAAAETEPLDPSFGNDYENEISHVEFEPDLGSTPYAVAAAPLASAATATATAAGETAPEPVTARNAAAGSRRMKWWLPPSTMPSFPLFPNPVGMPGIPGLPLPGTAFHPIGGWGTPAPPGQAQPSPPASTAGVGANDPNTNGGIN